MSSSLTEKFGNGQPEINGKVHSVEVSGSFETLETKGEISSDSPAPPLPPNGKKRLSVAPVGAIPDEDPADLRAIALREGQKRSESNLSQWVATEWAKSAISPDLFPFARGSNDVSLYRELTGIRGEIPGGVFWYVQYVNPETGMSNGTGCLKPKDPLGASNNDLELKYLYSLQVEAMAPKDLFSPKPLSEKKKKNLKPAKYLSFPKGEGQTIGYLPVTLQVWEKIAAQHPLASQWRDFIDEARTDMGFWNWIRANPSIPIVLTEGVKKAYSLLSQGRVAISLPGCWGALYSFKNGKKKIHPDLAAVVSQNRTIILCLDMDSEFNQQVREAKIATARAIKSAGCNPMIVHWDYKLGKGIDDLVLLSLQLEKGSSLPSPPDGISTQERKEVLESEEIKDALSADGKLLFEFALDDWAIDFIEFSGVGFDIPTFRTLGIDDSDGSHPNINPVAEFDLTNEYVPEKDDWKPRENPYRTWKEDFYKWTGTHYSAEDESGVPINDEVRARITKVCKAAGHKGFYELHNIADGAFRWLTNGKLQSLESAPPLQGLINTKDALFQAVIKDGRIALEPVNRTPNLPLFHSLKWRFDPGADKTHLETLKSIVTPGEWKIIAQTIAIALFGRSTLGIKGGTRIRALLLVGEGSNGKDSLRSVFSLLLGEESITNLNLSDFTEEDKFSKSPLLQPGIRLNWGTESSGKNLDLLQSLKGFISGDPILINQKFKDSQKLIFQGAMIFNSNESIYSSMAEHAESRWAIIKFRKSFSDDKEKLSTSESHLKSDPRFKDEAWVLENVVPALFNEVLEEAQGILDNLANMREVIDYSPIREILKEIKREGDHLVSFVEEMLVEEKGAFLPTTDVLPALHKWYVEQGFGRFKTDMFGQTEEFIPTERDGTADGRFDHLVLTPRVMGKRLKIACPKIGEPVQIRVKGAKIRGFQGWRLKDGNDGKMENFELIG